MNGPRVLGLTASLTYAVEEKKVKEAIARICSELKIEHMATASKEELKASGYHGNAAAAELRIPMQLPQGEMPRGVVLMENRKPHLMVQDFFGRAEMGIATEFGIRLLNLIQSLESVIPGFSSPLKVKPGNGASSLSTDLSRSSSAKSHLISQSGTSHSGFYSQVGRKMKTLWLLSYAC